MIIQETETLRQLAKSWNNLDTSFIASLLTDDLIFESQWVLIPIKGKKYFLSYLFTKFQTIKSIMNKNFMTVTAELAFYPKMENKPCIVLTQITVEGITQVSVLITMEHDKIKRIDICFIPDPAKAELTGEFPK